MNRTPPINVRRKLRKEVGFGCPVLTDGEPCGNPYLEWHHFDPPWRVKQHHNHKGMIALCQEHHKKADYGAFSTEQLYHFKEIGKQNRAKVIGRIDWLRNEILVIAGNNQYYQCDCAVRYKNSPVIWFNRDEDGFLLLNISSDLTV